MVCESVVDVDGINSSTVDVNICGSEGVDTIVMPTSIYFVTDEFDVLSQITGSMVLECA